MRARRDVSRRSKGDRVRKEREREECVPWRWEFNLSIYSTRTQECRIKDINSISSHNDLYHEIDSPLSALDPDRKENVKFAYLDILSRFEPIQLIQQLQHGTLYF